MKKLLLIAIMLVAFFIFFYGCEKRAKPALEKSLSFTKLSEIDIFNNYDEDVKRSLRKLIATGKCLKCTFTGTNLSGKDLGEIILISSNLAAANLASSNLEEADLYLADLSETNLNQANLKGANLSRADLSEANLNQANLE